MQKNGINAYFRGGTALYKALKNTKRFLEDIDISVDTRGCTRTQSDKLLEKVTKKYKSLERSSEGNRTNRSEIISMYDYSPIVEYDANDSLQRFGKLKVEATSFTISEPIEDLTITPIIYDFATQEQKKILHEYYGVSPFLVKTMTIERIFIDKIFATESYIRKSDNPHRAFEAAKHLYDISVMSMLPAIKELCIDADKMKYLLNIRLEEEKNRLDGVPGLLPKDFILFNSVKTNKNVRDAYEIMQKQYVFQISDRIPFDSAVSSLFLLYDLLSHNKSWDISQPERTSVRDLMSAIKATRNLHNSANDRVDDIIDINER